MAAALESIHQRYLRLKSEFAERDTRMSQVQSVRNGKMSEVAPDLFPASGPWQQPIVANMIDVAARDMAEMIAPLPSFNCTNPTMSSERAKSKATLKTKVAAGYSTLSSLQVQMYTSADEYVTHGFIAGRVEVDYEAKSPVIRLISPHGVYYENDRFNRLVSFYQHVQVESGALAALYPEHASKIMECHGTVDVVFYHDKTVDMAYWTHAPTQQQFVLSQVPNKLGKVMVVLAERPGGTKHPRGQFDDVLFVQLAKHRMALLALQAANDSVNAPLVVPNDVADIPMGPGATIRTANPAGVRRAGLEIPAAAFQEQAQLDRELQLGSRFPQVRTGETQGSTVTGKGVQALMGGYDTQIRTHQAVMARFLQELVSLCFEVDEKFFPNAKKNLRGSVNGVAYEVEYVPAKAIGGDYTVEVTYGLMAGLDPNRWLVFALQARAEKMFSRDFMRREMPVDLDVEQEAQKIDIEDLEEAAKQAIMGYAQSIPALASAGQDPSAPLAALAQVIDGRRKGKDLADLVVEAFTPKPKEAPATPEGVVAMAAEGPAAGGQMPPGMDATGLMPGVAPGQQGQAPGGMPDLATMLASFGGQGAGEANLAASVKRSAAF